MPADVIDYRIIGDDMQGVIITLDPNEAVFAEAGAMMYMEDGIQMATTLDPSGTGGGLFGKLVGAGKRMLTGESFFITLFGNAASQRRDVAFAAPTPGKVYVADLRMWGGELIAQKDAFLCAARGIDMDIAFTRRIGAGFFGGEGFILQEAATLPCFDGNYPICGVWIVAHEACGLGIREDRSRITGNGSRFIPHFF